MKLYLLILPALLIAISILAIGAKADNHYCDGNDVQATINAASANDTIYFKTGTHTEAGSVIFDKPLTLIGNDSSAVLVSTVSGSATGFIMTGGVFNVSSLNFTTTATYVVMSINSSATLNMNNSQVFSITALTTGILAYGTLNITNSTINVTSIDANLLNAISQQRLANCTLIARTNGQFCIGSQSNSFNLHLDYCNLSANEAGIRGATSACNISITHTNITSVGNGINVNGAQSLVYINDSNLSSGHYSINSNSDSSTYVWNTTYGVLKAFIGTIFLWNTTTVYVPGHASYEVGMVSYRTGEGQEFFTNSTGFANATLMYLLNWTGYHSIVYRYIIVKPLDWDTHPGTVSVSPNTTVVDYWNEIYWDGISQNYTLINRWVPLPHFTLTNNTAAGQNATFNASTTIDNDTIPALLSCSWDFGDGNTTTRTVLQAENHIYDSLGIYNVTLVVSDGTTPPQTITHQIWIAGHIPVPNIVSNSPVNFGKLMYFGAFGSIYDGAAPTYSWYFNDTATWTNGPTTSHFYSAMGNYNVTLYILDQSAQNNSTTASVEVLEASNVSIELSSGTTAVCWSWDTINASDFLALYPDIAWISTYNETTSQFQTLYSAGFGIHFALNFSHSYYIGSSINLTIYQPIPGINATFSVSYGSSFRGDCTNKRMTPSDFFNASSDVAWIGVKTDDRFAYYYSWSPEIYTVAIECFEAVYIGCSAETAEITL